MNIAEATHPIGRRAWSVDGFSAFWAKPDAARVAGVLTEDVAGYWPAQTAPFRGPSAYVRPIAELLLLAPDFTLQVEDHGAGASASFVRWRARGTTENGLFECEGVDCIRLREGQVCENRIFSDHEIFRWLASRVRPTGS